MQGTLGFPWTNDDAGVRFIPPEPGEYRLKLTLSSNHNLVLDETHIAVSGQFAELTNPSPDIAAMREIAENGGAHAHVTDPGALTPLSVIVDHLRKRLKPDEFRTIRRSRPMWLPWLWLPVLLLVFLAWRLEGPRP